MFRHFFDALLSKKDDKPLDEGDGFFRPQLSSDRDWILPPRIAKKYDRNTFNYKKPYFPSGITGQAYFPYRWRKLSDFPRAVKIVPQPDNTVDCHALKVVHKSKQIGWIKAEIAAWLAPYVYLLLQADSECLVYLTEPNTEEWEMSGGHAIRDVQIGVMILPTLEFIWKVFPPQRIWRELDIIWNSLPSDVAERIHKLHWNLDEETATVFKQIGQEKTSYPFALPATEDLIISNYLCWYRRIVYSLQDKRRRADRNIKICQLDKAGLPRKEIATQTGLARSTVASFVRKGRDPKIVKSWMQIRDSIPAEEDELREYIAKNHQPRDPR